MSSKSWAKSESIFTSLTKSALFLSWKHRDRNWEFQIFEKMLEICVHLDNAEGSFCRVELSCMVLISFS